MTNTIITFGTVIVWVLSMVIATEMARRRNQRRYEDYILAGRGLSYLLVTASLLGTWIGGGTMVALAGQISREGMVYMFMPLGVAISFLLLGYLAPAYRSTNKNTTEALSIESDAPTSLVDRFAREYGEEVRRPMAISVCLMMLAFMAVQLRAGALVFAHVIHTDALLAIILFACAIAAYVWAGGARADAYTDLVQILIVIVAVFAGILALLLNGTLYTEWTDAGVRAPNLFSLSPGAGVLIPGLMILPILTMHTDTGLHQKLLTARGDREASKGSYVAAIVFMVFGVALVALCILASRYLPEANAADGVLVAFASRALHPVLQILFYAAILAAVSSTLDSEAILVGTVMVNDLAFWHKCPISQKGNEAIQPSKEEVSEAAFSLSRLWAAICIFAGFLLTLVPLQLFSLLGAIWVCALVAFSIPALALKWQWLRRGLSGRRVMYMILWSIVGIVFYTAYLSSTGLDDLTKPLITVAFGAFILNFLIGVTWAIRRRPDRRISSDLKENPC